jgi:hypothetical protein
MATKGTRSRRATSRSQAGARKGSRGYVLYSAYIFKDKDPAIDAIRTVMQDHFGRRNLTSEDYAEVHEQGGPTAGCVKSWFEGKTKRPQNATLEAAGRALGYHRVWQPIAAGLLKPKRRR